MAHYINLATGRFPMAISAIKSENPNTSYPVNIAVFDGYQEIVDPVEPVYDSMTQRLVLVPPTLDSLVYAYRVDPLSEQEIADNITNKTLQEAVRVRQTRGEKLEACDWHGLSDNVMTAEMTTYRQALRDVPQQDEFPNEINWPVEPN